MEIWHRAQGGEGSTSRCRGDEGEREKQKIFKFGWLKSKGLSVAILKCRRKGTFLSMM